MVSEFLLDIVFNIVTAILDSTNLGVVSWDVSSDALAPFMNIVQTVCYFLPMDAIAGIVDLIVIFAIFRAGIRLIVTIWELLPIA